MRANSDSRANLDAIQTELHGDAYQRINRDDDVIVNDSQFTIHEHHYPQPAPPAKVPVTDKLFKWLTKALLWILLLAVGTGLCMGTYVAIKVWLNPIIKIIPGENWGADVDMKIIEPPE